MGVKELNTHWRSQNFFIDKTEVHVEYVGPENDKGGYMEIKSCMDMASPTISANADLNGPLSDITRHHHHIWNQASSCSFELSGRLTSVAQRPTPIKTNKDNAHVYAPEPSGQVYSLPENFGQNCLHYIKFGSLTPNAAFRITVKT